MLEGTADEIAFNDSLLFITENYKKLLNKKAIILIDEYDSPITHSYVYKHYEKIIKFMRQLLSKALKGNTNLHKGFMTGVVRTAKDGILSGLNNLKICTMLDRNFADKFGFTQKEVESLLEGSGRGEKIEEVKSWYNGYVIAAEYLNDPLTAHLAASVYNPWSILSYLEGSSSPKTYWANTGSKELLERLIAEASSETREELKCLIEGQALRNKEINQDIILLDLDKKTQEPWSFLFFAGYITACKHSFQNNKHLYTLAIPNEEIKELYKSLVTNVISRTFSSKNLENLLQALVEGNISTFNALLKEFISSMCSFHDLPQDDAEKSVHMFVLGLLSTLIGRFVIKSNLESGDGRYDILMHPKQATDPAIVTQFKKGKSLALDELADVALKQIKDKKYTSQIRDFGYKGKVICYGIATFKKELMVKMEHIYI